MQIIFKDPVSQTVRGVWDQIARITW
jgi:hypothetical protein